MSHMQGDVFTICDTLSHVTPLGDLRVCRFVLASLPADTDLAALASSIPERVRQLLLRGGLNDSWPDHTHFAFDPVNTSLSLPFADEQLVRCTRVHCDCWSTLTTDSPNRKELARWRTIFDSIHNIILRFGLIVHFGDPTDVFDLAGPTLLPMSEAAPLHRLQLDTYYDVIP